MLLSLLRDIHSVVTQNAVIQCSEALESVPKRFLDFYHQLSFLNVFATLVAEESPYGKQLKIKQTLVCVFVCVRACAHVCVLITAMFLL